MQSTRFARGHTFVPADVKAWKAEVRRQLMAYKPERPIKGPIQIIELTYRFRLPSSTATVDELCDLFEVINNRKIEGSTKKQRMEALRQQIADGAPLPYLAKADLMDNLNKGLIDCMTGLFWEDDSQIWESANARKIYDLKDGITIKIKMKGDVS